MTKVIDAEVVGNRADDEAASNPYLRSEHTETDNFDTLPCSGFFFLMQRLFCIHEIFYPLLHSMNVLF